MVLKSFKFVNRCYTKVFIWNKTDDYCDRKTHILLQSLLFKARKMDDIWRIFAFIIMLQHFIGTGNENTLNSHLMDRWLSQAQNSYVV